MDVEIRMPEFAEEDATARAAEWLVEVGQDVQAGQAVLEVETDKAVLAVEAPQAGRLAKRLVTEGEELASNQPVGVLTAD